MPSAADALVSQQPATTTVATPVNIVAGIVTSFVDAGLSPFAATTAPVAPARRRAVGTDGLARREFEQTFFTPSPTVNPLAGQITRVRLF